MPGGCAGGWQQILAVDSRTAPARARAASTSAAGTASATIGPHFDHQVYLKRRLQLLQASAMEQEDPDLSGGAGPIRSKRYLSLRVKLLKRQLAIPKDVLSMKSLSLHSQRHQHQPGQAPGEPHAGNNNLPSWPGSGNEPVLASDRFSFSGVHHIFDQHREGISRLMFANGEDSLLVSACMDGSLSVCDLAPLTTTSISSGRNDQMMDTDAGCSSSSSATTTPPSFEPTYSSLVGHSEAILDCDLSESNQFLISCSLDGSVCLWDVSKRCKLREVRVAEAAPGASHVTFARFLPRNNNLVACGVVGGSSSVVRLMNISTGKFLPGAGSPLLGRSLRSETASAPASSADILWVGNDRGVVESFRVESSAVCLPSKRAASSSSLVQKGCRVSLNQTGPTQPQHQLHPQQQQQSVAVTALSWHACLMRVPCLLVALASTRTSFHLFRVTDEFGSLEPMLRFAGAPATVPRCAALAPMLSFKDGTLTVAGMYSSDDGALTFYDLEKCVSGSPAHAQNKLLGHSRPVISVAFSHSEKYLASADAAGQIIVWKK